MVSTRIHPSRCIPSTPVCSARVSRTICCFGQTSPYCSFQDAEARMAVVLAQRSDGGRSVEPHESELIIIIFLLFILYTWILKLLLLLLYIIIICTRNDRETIVFCYDPCTSPVLLSSPPNGAIPLVEMRSPTRHCILREFTYTYTHTRVIYMRSCTCILLYWMYVVKFSLSHNLTYITYPLLFRLILHSLLIYIYINRYVLLV